MAMAKDGALDDLLNEVVGRYDNSPNARLKEVTTAAIKHIHAFAREVNLTRDEWFAGINFLNTTGQISVGPRQEFILLSDTIGLSALVEMLAYDASAPTLTDNTVLGPWFVPGSPERAKGATMLDDPDDGDRVVVRGRVTNVDGEPLANVALDCWQNASNMFYAVQQPEVQSEMNLRGIYRTDANGEYELRAVRPVAYPVPSDGPAGDLLKKNGRNWWRPGHLHIWVKVDGYKDLITHVFDVASPHLDSDAVFGVQRSLIREFTPDATGELSTTFDIVLDRA
jgi:protocatechuate 3,4-dioxygenase beta subunit